MKTNNALRPCIKHRLSSIVFSSVILLPLFSVFIISPYYIPSSNGDVTLWIVNSSDIHGHEAHNVMC